MPRSPHSSSFAPTTVALAVALEALLAACLLATAEPALAQVPSTEASYGLSGSVGVNIGTLPTHEGSPHHRTVVFPDLMLSYRTRDWGTVELGPRGLMWQAFESGEFRVGLLAGVDPGRKTEDLSTIDSAQGDKRLAGMGKVRASAEAGLGISYGPVTLLARQSLGDRGHKGVQADLSLQLPMKITDHFSLSAGAGATWADKKYMQAYFGVTAAQAAATSFQAFAPRSGLRKAELNMGAELAMASDWKLRGGVAVSSLRGDAATSPLVVRRSGVSASIGVACAF